MRLSKNFSYDELVYSATAERLKLDNTPNEKEIEFLRKLANEVLQPIRDKWGRPIVVTSGFRSEKVNNAVGGVKNSQHRLGQAADLKIGSKSQNKALPYAPDTYTGGVPECQNHSEGVKAE